MLEVGRDRIEKPISTRSRLWLVIKDLFAGENEAATLPFLLRRVSAAVFGPLNSLIKGLKYGSGRGTRTPDPRIMIPVL